VHYSVIQILVIRFIIWMSSLSEHVSDQLENSSWSLNTCYFGTFMVVVYRNFDRVKLCPRAGLLPWSNWNLVFVEKGNQRTRRKTFRTKREPTTNSTHIWHGAGIKPGPHWWKASVLITAPSLLPRLLRRPQACEATEAKLTNYQFFFFCLGVLK